MAQENWNKAIGGFIVGLVVMFALAGVYNIATVEEPKIITIEDTAKIAELEAEAVQHKNTTDSLLETVAEQDTQIQKLMDESTSFYDEYGDEIREVAVRKLAVDWFEVNYLDELDLDGKAYDDYEFDVLIQRNDLMDIDAEDDEDSSVKFDFKLQVYDGTAETLYPGTAEIIVEEDGDIDDDDSEILVTGFP